eukprot:360165-Chlamydomonas_euryale.AAC.1
MHEDQSNCSPPRPVPTRVGLRDEPTRPPPRPALRVGIPRGFQPQISKRGPGTVRRVRRREGIWRTCRPKAAAPAARHRGALRPWRWRSAINVPAERFFLPCAPVRRLPGAMPESIRVEKSRRRERTRGGSGAGESGKRADGRAAAAPP